MSAGGHTHGLWIPCPLCYRWMKWDEKAGGYECKLCLESAHAAGWNPEGQGDLFSAQNLSTHL